MTSGAEGRLDDELRHVARVGFISSLMGVTGLGAMSVVPGLFGPGRALWVLLLVPVYIGYAIRTALGRNRLSDLRLLCLYACGHVTLQGLLATSATLRELFLLALVVAPLGAAMTLPPRIVRLILGAAVSGVAVLVLVAGDASLFTRSWVCVGILFLCAAPTLVVQHYRGRLESARSDAERLARTDTLTGLANRRGLAERVPELVAAAAASGRTVAVLAADLDHFKSVNDRFGHAVGDEVLRAAADSVSGSVHLGDVVARIGGEEICVVAVLDDAQQTHGLAERVRADLELNAVQWRTTVSVGAVAAPASTLLTGGAGVTESLWDMLDQADHLLYEAKNAGRNAVRVRAA